MELFIKTTLFFSPGAVVIIVLYTILGSMSLAIAGLFFLLFLIELLIFWTDKDNQGDRGEFGSFCGYLMFPTGLIILICISFRIFVLVQ